jgi:hydroxyethylthiazole kinase
MKHKAAKIIDLVRKQSPLVDCITNYVTVNDCANILLAFGASPAMCDALDVAYDFARISAALYINFGTYLKEQEAAAVEAVLGARKAGRPIIVDPVGCGAIRRRIDILAHLHEVAGVDIIKGNMGEIMALAGKDAGVKGVDSTEEVAGIEEVTVKLAQQYHCVVAATGKVDVISDGNNLAQISNGVGMLKKITGAGCMAGALCGATAAAAAANAAPGTSPSQEDMFAAAVAAISVMGIAGEMAYERAQAPGSFRVALMDSVYGITGETILQRGKIVC